MDNDTTRRALLTGTAGTTVALAAPAGGQHETRDHARDAAGLLRCFLLAGGMIYRTDGTVWFGRPFPGTQRIDEIYTKLGSTPLRSWVNQMAHQYIDRFGEVI